MTDYRLQITNYRLQITGYDLVIDEPMRGWQITDVMKDVIKDPVSDEQLRYRFLMRQITDEITTSAGARVMTCSARASLRRLQTTHITDPRMKVSE